MTTTSSIQNLVPLIENLSQNLMAIASLLKEDAQAALPWEEAKQDPGPEPELAKETEKTDSEEEKSAAGSTAESSKRRKTKITKEEIRAVLAEKSQAGLTEKVKELLHSYGARNLSEIKSSDYEELLAAAQALK